MLEPLHIFLIKLDIGQSVVATCHCPAECISVLIITVHKKLFILQKRGLKEFRIAQCAIWVDTTLEITMATGSFKETAKMGIKDEEEKLEASMTMLPEEVSKKDKAELNPEKEAKFQSMQDTIIIDSEPWRQIKYVPREVLIIGSFGNHDDWPQQQHECSYLSEQWMLETAGIIEKYYLKNTKDYQLHEIPESEQTKTYYMECISKIFINCKKDGVIIYYTGHGEKDTGNWCFKDGVISFNDIFNLFKEHLQKKGLSLTVVSDCSYSGNWIYDCADRLDKMKIPSCGHHTRENNILIQVVASCQHNEEVTASYAKEAVNYIEASQVVKFKYGPDTVLSSGQKPMGADFRTIRCDKEPCEVDAICTWNDYVSNYYSELIAFSTSLEKEADRYWHIAAIEKDEIKSFIEELANGKINRKIIKSHRGKTLPKEISREVYLQTGKILKHSQFEYIL
ncbi:PREDICTED: uncharacterized protein LOC109591181 [Amphimedon queenslandica]|uniref:Uncharacterized protein n=2 Tax=Amphimedon queenslandica TaxID=400682 RepID=A0AAN0K033_AMPQE|nr:PREDICTED: uncharacterized protein LOC109591181 [Amphimedon queenslandica]|eukprot:XP_019862523.1 PREDICTED: uncharacterized protein LOC109591181 [Amphimedon queenslandica]